MTDNMKFLLKDPTHPDLFTLLDQPQLPNVYPPFSVVGYSGPRTDVGSSDWRAAQALYTVASGLRAVEPILPSSWSRWPRTQVLYVLPEAGKDFNAYYDGQALRFFYDTDPVTNQVVYAADATDVVAHELGHSILDSLRPDLWSTQSLEVWAFHEAFGDLTAIFTIMTYEDLLKHALQETGGDLMKPNILSRLAEQLGGAVYHLVGGKGGFQPDALREANNSFVYQAPETLPQVAPDNQLAAECHSFGRVFVGAYYEIMTKIFAKERANNNNDLEALKQTRTIASEMLVRSASQAAASPRFYDSVARSILAYDQQNGSKYQDDIESVFVSRKILSRRSIKAQSVNHIDDLRNSFEPERFLTQQGADGSTFVRVKNTKTVKLAEHFGTRAQSNNPLYNVEIEIPAEQHFFFNSSGLFVDGLSTSEQVAIKSARACISFLHKNNLWANGKLPDGDMSKPFSVIDGKLVRNFFICGNHKADKKVDKKE